MVSYLMELYCHRKRESCETGSERQSLCCISAVGAPRLAPSPAQPPGPASGWVDPKTVFKEGWWFVTGQSDSELHSNLGLCVCSAGEEAAGSCQ